jgi:O-acetylserine/cysteine efflux transporter
MPLRDYALVLLVCTVWAFNFIAGAKGMEAFSPLLFMSLRFALLLSIALPFMRLPPAGQWLRLAGACLFVGAFHFTAMFWALKLSADVTSIALLQQMYVPIAVLLAIALLGERAGWRTLLATGIAFCGVLLIGLDPLVLAQPLAMALILLSALLQALGSVFMRGLHGLGPVSFQGWTAAFSLPVMLLATWLLEDGQLATMAAADTIYWGALLYSVIMASLVGHGLFFALVQRHPLPTLMPYMLLTPLLATLMGVLVWGDRPGWRLLAGGSLVLSGILVITLRGRARALARARAQRRNNRQPG